MTKINNIEIKFFNINLIDYKLEYFLSIHLTTIPIEFCLIDGKNNHDKHESFKITKYYINQFILESSINGSFLKR